ncbi:uncharacterized protein LOC114531291 [Dendronephthya gigantea]|uniref:uncharacterized protein LOC114531291 n=1 Tax=Dendronephthya gigantea TaxID=151771 RepID=UPI0010697E27|nr:uncharacterized protein LOC114531291 [Dendronephthya gigantea]
MELIEKARELANHVEEEADSPAKEEISKEAEPSQATNPIAEWVNLVTEEICNPSRTERLRSDDLVCLEKYIKEFPAKYVYTHRASRKEPLTEKIRKSMTENVKSAAYNDLLNHDNHTNDGNFFYENQVIVNFARDDVYKNVSTKMPARLLASLATYIKSIARISCENAVGTCWLVSNRLVITNFHVYMQFNTQRVISQLSKKQKDAQNKQTENTQGMATEDTQNKETEDTEDMEIDDCQNCKLPINVLFDFLYPNQVNRVLWWKLMKNKILCLRVRT